jgi:hypothetical protein
MQARLAPFSMPSTPTTDKVVHDGTSDVGGKGGPNQMMRPLSAISGSNEGVGTGVGIGIAMTTSGSRPGTGSGKGYVAA